MSRIGEQVKSWLVENDQMPKNVNSHADERIVLDVLMANVDDKLSDFSAAVHWGDRKIIAEQAIGLVWSVVQLCEKIDIPFDTVWNLSLALRNAEKESAEVDAQIEKAVQKGDRL